MDFDSLRILSIWNKIVNLRSTRLKFKIVNQRQENNYTTMRDRGSNSTPIYSVSIIRTLILFGRVFAHFYSQRLSVMSFGIMRSQYNGFLPFYLHSQLEFNGPEWYERSPILRHPSLLRFRGRLTGRGMAFLFGWPIYSNPRSVNMPHLQHKAPGGNYFMICFLNPGNWSVRVVGFAPTFPHSRFSR